MSDSVMRLGKNVGDCAKGIFPGGVEIEYEPSNQKLMVRKTNAAISSQAKSIYEGTFISEDGVLIRADILNKTSTGWNVYEVKAVKLHRKVTHHLH